MKRRTGLVVGLVVAVAALAAATGLALVPGERPSKPAVAVDDYAADVVRELRVAYEQAAMQLKAGLPITLEEGGLTLVDVEAGPGLGLTYTYRLDRTPDGAGRAELAGRMRPRLAAQVCGEADIRDYMEYGVSCRYRYVDPAGGEVLVVDVDEAVCRKLEAAGRK